MGYPLKNLLLQIGNVIGGDEVNEVIRVGFARLAPSTSWDSASRVTGDNVGDAEDDEFHQRFACRRAAGVYCGIIPTHDHRRGRKCTAATLEIDSCEKIERRFRQMNMRGLARSGSGFVVDCAVECDEHYKNGVSQLVLLHLGDDILTHHA